MNEVEIGAVLLDNLRTRCEVCRCFQNVQWRKGWDSSILKRKVTLCNACGIKFTKKQYCQYCHDIYMKSTMNFDEWLRCAKCHEFTHVNCEQKHKEGQYYDEDIYYCPRCS